MTTASVPARSAHSAGGNPAERVSLVDLLDRVLAGGVVITGEITLSVADVDLVVISLRALLSSVSALLPDTDSSAGTGGNADTGSTDDRAAVR
jgi:Gas vesicle protein